MAERRLYVASVMARKDGQYTHRVLYTKARSKRAAKSWFERETARLYPQCWTAIMAEEVACS